MTPELLQVMQEMLSMIYANVEVQESLIINLQLFAEVFLALLHKFHPVK